MGHNWIRSDLRQDLAHLALLKSYPLRGRAIVRAEVTASTLALTTLQYSFVLVAWYCLHRVSSYEPYFTPLSLLFTIPGLLLVLNGMILTIQNAGALLFPDWVRFDRVRPGGFETLGQNILTTAFTFLLTLAGLVLPVALGALALALLKGPLGSGAYLPAGLAFAAVAVAEIIALLEWMGHVFERTEMVS
jgi:hypothetical protein